MKKKVKTDGKKYSTEIQMYSVLPSTFCVRFGDQEELIYGSQINWGKRWAPFVLHT